MGLVNDFNIVYELSFRVNEESQKIPFFKSILFSGLINNIFGEKYVSNGYYFTYNDTWSVPGETTTIEGAGFYPQATTNFLVGVSLKF